MQVVGRQQRVFNYPVSRTAQRHPPHPQNHPKPSHVLWSGSHVLWSRVVIIRRLIIICNMLGLYYDIRIIKRILPRQVGHHCTHDVTQVGAAVLDTWGLEVPQAPPGYESRHSSGIAPCGWWCLGSPTASPLHPTRATALHRLA